MACHNFQIFCLTTPITGKKRQLKMLKFFCSVNFLCNKNSVQNTKKCQNRYLPFAKKNVKFEREALKNKRFK